MGLELKILRTKKMLSQEKLAEKMKTYQRRISRIERGEATPSADELKALRKILLDE